MFVREAAAVAGDEVAPASRMEPARPPSRGRGRLIRTLGWTHVTRVRPSLKGSNSNDMASLLIHVERVYDPILSSFRKTKMGNRTAGLGVPRVHHSFWTSSEQDVLAVFRHLNKSI